MKLSILFALCAFSAPAFAQNPIQCGSPQRSWPSYSFYAPVKGPAILSADDEVELKCPQALGGLPLKSTTCASENGEWQVELAGKNGKVFKIDGKGKKLVRGLNCTEVLPPPAAKNSEALNLLVQKKFNVAEMMQALGSEKWALSRAWWKFERGIS